MGMDKHIAVYVRVSTNQQDTASQMPDLERYAAGQTEPIKWYEDHFTGTTMDRPGWQRLYADLLAGKVSKVVIWRLDRLGRGTAATVALFDELRQKKIPLVSMMDGFDLFTPGGRLFASMLASFAQYETEVRRERVLAGQAVAKAKGKTWGGSAKGKVIKTSANPEQIRLIKKMKVEGESITSIASATGLTRRTVYKYLPAA